MSTNYYFELALGESNRLSRIIYRMHIGKASRSSENIYGLSTVSGIHFPDVDSWVKFLRHNADSGKIVSEYAEEMDIEEFISEFLEDDAPTSASQIQWLEDHADDPIRGGQSIRIYDASQPGAQRELYWIDPKSQKLFFRGEFF